MYFLNLFGKNKCTDIPPHQVIQNLRDSLNLLEKRELYLEKRIKDIKIEARSYIKSNKNKALLLLKKAKLNEKQLISIYGQKDNLDTQILVLEQGITNQNTIKCIKEGKQAIENMTNKCDPDDVGELVDDIASIIDMTDEISTALSQPIGPVYDEDELLSLLDDEENNTQHNTQHNTHKIPIQNIVSQEEEKELKELVAMML
jgi:charged multivesicular body protein 4